MDKSDVYSEASYQGQPVDVGAEPGEAILSTDNSASDAESTESQTPREASNSQGKDQAQAVTKAAIDYEKSYKELEKKYTRDSQQRSAYEKQLKEYQAQTEIYRRFEAKLAEDKEAYQYLQQRFSGQKQVDPTLANDPLYQHLKPLVDEIGGLKQFVNTFQQEKQMTAANTALDQAESVAKAEIKSVLGRDATKEDLVKVYEWISQHGVLNGKLAARDVIWDEYGSAKTQQVLKDQQIKKGMGTTKVNGINSNAAKEKSDGIMSARQAIKEAAKEIGYT